MKQNLLTDLGLKQLSEELLGKYMSEFHLRPLIEGKFSFIFSCGPLISITERNRRQLEQQQPQHQQQQQ